MTHLKILDVIILALSISIAATAGIRMSSSQKGTPYAVIETPANRWIYPLDEDTDVYIEGSAGITHIRIQNNSLFFEDSPCFGKTCILAAPIKTQGQWIACLPNQVIARIVVQDSNTNLGFDVIVH